MLTLCAAASALDIPATLGVASLTVDCYPGEIFRVRMRPDRAHAPYEVQDVIEPAGVPCPPTSGAGGVWVSAPEGWGRKLEVRFTENAATIEVLTLAGAVELSGTLHAWGGDRAGAEQIIGEFVHPSAAHVYGIPERATHLLLPEMNYRLWNLDVFKYPLHVDGGLYGTVPLLTAITSGGAASGVFWLNAADTRCAISTHPPSPPHLADGGKASRWVSDVGVYDVLFLPGPTPAAVVAQLGGLTGRPAMPPLFALGYHQCRWNYRSEEDVDGVDANFDSNLIPYDVLWLDIEHTDGKRYFTWDKAAFPDPKGMLERMEAKGRKVVVITDPHIKRAGGYHVHEQAEAGGHYVKRAGGDAAFEGHCWPGQSSWIDFTSPATRDWYATLFSYESYAESSPIVYFWIDMNEPSVFSGDEVTMDKRAVHAGGVEHREIHNQYGFYMNMATYHAVLRRSLAAPSVHVDGPTRPFILTRSFFAGTQRYAAVWTGDNMANWEHLAISYPMLFSLSMAGVPFVGADVPGFFGNPPTEELVVRWYQIGVTYPFFRAHAHHETARREPWLFSTATNALVREAVILRYRLLPYIYATFWDSHCTGAPVLRPLLYSYPTDPDAVAAETVGMLGDSLLAAPVMRAGATSVTAYLPGGGAALWYDLVDTAADPLRGGLQDVAAPLGKLPLFVLGGKVVPLRMRLRRSSHSMQADPYTLVVAADAAGHASGRLYEDDGHSFRYGNGAFTERLVSLAPAAAAPPAAAATTARFVLWSEAAPKRAAPCDGGDGSEPYAAATVVERIVLRGVAGVSAAHVVSADGLARRAVPLVAEGQALSLRVVDLPVGQNWRIEIE